MLLIGDSISIGYTFPVRELLKDKANVHRVPTNGRSTKGGLADIDTWLKPRNWHVIHFNFGFHDLMNTTGANATCRSTSFIFTDEGSRFLGQIVAKSIILGSGSVRKESPRWGTTVPQTPPLGGTLPAFTTTHHVTK